LPSSLTLLPGGAVGTRFTFGALVTLFSGRTLRALRALETRRPNLSHWSPHTDIALRARVHDVDLNISRRVAALLHKLVEEIDSALEVGVVRLDSPKQEVRVIEPLLLDPDLLVFLFLQVLVEVVSEGKRVHPSVES